MNLTPVLTRQSGEADPYVFGWYPAVQPTPAQGGPWATCPCGSRWRGEGPCFACDGAGEALALEVMG